MNYIKHLTGFFEKVANDRQLNPTHVSLYMALFQFWNCNRFRNPISISRDELMRISKISSKATYHKCLKGLHAHSYIKYEPSYNPFRGSHVYLFDFADDLKPLLKSEKLRGSIFKPVDEQVLNKSQASTNSATEQVDNLALVPSINNINNSNIKNIEKGLNMHATKYKIENENLDFENESGAEKEKDFAEKEKEEIPDVTKVNKKIEDSRQDVAVEKAGNLLIPTVTKPSADNPINKAAVPTLENILSFFRESDFPEFEANKFYNYFQSIGWLVGGKTPMSDWSAAARNWMLNAPKYVTNERTDRTKTFDTSAGKNYFEPL